MMTQNLMTQILKTIFTTKKQSQREIEKEEFSVTPCLCDEPLLKDAVVEFFSFPVGGGLHECEHQGMRLAGFGSELGLE